MAHETAYSEKILNARRKELKCLWKNKVARSWLHCMTVIAPAFTLIISLLWYTKGQRRPLTASVAFSSIMITEQMRGTYTVRLLLTHVGEWDQAQLVLFSLSTHTLEAGFKV